MVKKKRKGNSSSDDIYDAEHIVRHKYENGKLLYRVKWKGWSSNHDTWEPETNILDKRLIEHYEKKLKEESAKKENQKEDKRKKVEPAKVERRTEPSEDEQSEDEEEKVDKRTLDKLAKLCKDETKVKLISSNSTFRLEPVVTVVTEPVDYKAPDDEPNKETSDSPIDIVDIVDVVGIESTEPDHPKNSPTRSNGDLVESFSVSRPDDLQESLSNDSTLCDESNDPIDSRPYDSSNEIEKQNGADTFGQLKRKYDSIGADDVHGSHGVLGKYQPTKEPLDHHHVRQAIKVNQINEQTPVKRSMGDLSPYSDQRSENSVFSLNSSQFNGNRNEFSFQDHLNRPNDANNNRVRSYKPEFLKKKTNLLDQVVITDVTANNTTITVRESKSLKFFFKDGKKTNGGQLQF